MARRQRLPHNPVHFQCSSFFSADLPCCDPSPLPVFFLRGCPCDFLVRSSWTSQIAFLSGCSTDWVPQARLREYRIRPFYSPFLVRFLPPAELSPLFPTIPYGEISPDLLVHSLQSQPIFVSPFPPPFRPPSSSKRGCSFKKSSTPQQPDFPPLIFLNTVHSNQGRHDSPCDGTGPVGDRFFLWPPHPATTPDSPRPRGFRTHCVKKDHTTSPNFPSPLNVLSSPQKSIDKDDVFRFSPPFPFSCRPRLFPPRCGSSPRA